MSSKQMQKTKATQKPVKGSKSTPGRVDSKTNARAKKNRRASAPRVSSRQADEEKKTRTSSPRVPNGKGATVSRAAQQSVASPAKAGKVEPKKRVKREHPDSYQEKLFKDVWCALIKDTFFSYPLTDLLFHIQRNKLAESVNLALMVADYALYGGERPMSPFLRVYDLYTAKDPEHLRKVLEVCRFGKRYTPSELPGDLQPFWETNERVGRYDPTQHGVIVSAMRDQLSDMLKSYRVDWEEWSLTNGSDYEKDSTVVEKLLSVEQYYPDLLGIGLGTPVSNIAQGAKAFVNENRMTCVPKTIEKVRYIAMEPQWMSVRAGCVGKAIERCLPQYANIHDQSHNQDLARLASIDNGLCTVDLSAASDSLSLLLMEQVLPPHVLKDVLQYTSRSMTPRRDAFGEPQLRRDPSFGWVRVTPLYTMISTMGNRITFPLETLVFSAALEVTASFMHADTSPATCGVYGDDIICPNEWYETLCGVLEACGFTINEKKSFHDSSHFRESCGYDCYKGKIVSSSYWPRKAITKEDGLPSLVALQHKFWNMPHVNDVLTCAIRELCPKITESLPGSPYDDLWSLYPIIHRVYGSYDKGATEAEPSCEIHTMFESEKGNTAWNENNDRYRYYEFLKRGHIPHADPVLAAIGYPADRDTSQGLVHPKVQPKNRKHLI